MSVDLSCRLPAVVSTGENYTGGFISFPQASFAPDPKGGFTTDSQTGVISTLATPVLKAALGGIGGVPFYDAARGRWVPAGSFQSTPDGSRYAYETGDPSTGAVFIHVVDVGSGRDTAFKVAMPVQANGLAVADFDSSGVYLLANGFESLPEGVWLMDPSTGALRRLDTVGTVAAVRGGYAWAAAIDPRDPSPPQLRRSGTSSDSIVRVDLRTGASVVWFYRPGMQVELSGFDAAGNPIVEVTDPSGASGDVETLLASNTVSPVTIFNGNLYLGHPQGDGDRIWFSGVSDVYLYADGGLRKVVSFPNPAFNQSLNVVGFCR